MDLEDPTILSRFEEFLKIDKIKSSSFNTKYLVYGILCITGLIIIWVIWKFFIKTPIKPKKKNKRKTKKKIKHNIDIENSDESTNLFAGLDTIDVQNCPITEKINHTSELLPDASADFY